MNITELLDRPIAYHRVFVTLTGSVKAAILLSQAMYWQKRAKQADGWWYKTAEEWQEETGLTRHELDTARRDCEKYLKTDLRDAPARMYWRVDEDELSSSLFAEKRQTGLPESDKQVSPKATNINRNAETTTEINYKGEKSPSILKTDELPLEWQIVGNVENITGIDETHSERMDFANILAMGTPDPTQAYQIAMAFQDERGITLLTNKAKNQRKVVIEMIRMGVTGEDVKRATRQLMDKKMTVADLFSVSKTAIDLANKPTPKQEGFYL
jgi:hypothetical protein